MAEDRNAQVVRVLQLVQDLEREALTVYELAERHGTTVRTIRRDLNALAEAGIPLVDELAEDSARVRKSIDTRGARKLAGLLSTAHYLALKVALADGQARRPRAIFSSLEDLAARVEQALGTKARGQLERIERCFFSWEKFAWKDAPVDVLWPLIEAIDARRLCELTYRAPSSGNKERTYAVLPLRLFSYNGTMYAHAWQPKFKQVLLLNLQRVKRLKVLDTRAEVPASYDVEALEQSTFGIFLGKDQTTYRLRFDAEMAPYLRERLWHPTQRLTVLPGGGLELRFTCARSYEVSAWVASWKHHVEVLEPAELRDELRGFGAWLQKTYGRRAGRKRSSPPGD